MKDHSFIDHRHHLRHRYSNNFTHLQKGRGVGPFCTQVIDFISPLSRTPLKIRQFGSEVCPFLRDLLLLLFFPSIRLDFVDQQIMALM